MSNRWFLGLAYDKVGGARPGEVLQIHYSATKTQQQQIFQKQTIHQPSLSQVHHSQAERYMGIGAN